MTKQNRERHSKVNIDAQIKNFEVMLLMGQI